MKLNRRLFLENSLKTAGALAIAGPALGATSLPPYFPIDGRNPNPYNPKNNYRGLMAVMQGLTTLHTSQFVVLIESKKTYGYQVFDDKNQSYPVQVTLRETRSYSDWGIEKVFVSGLNPKGNYRLRIIDGASGQIIDARSFKSLDTNLKSPKIMIASCMKDNNEEKREVMWDNVAESKPDIVFLIGDTCYADNGNDGSDEGYWRRYTETRSLLSHFRQKDLIPTLAVWDDHDFGGNNYDGTFAKKEMTKQLFNTFWGNIPQEGTLIKGPGVAQIFKAFGQRFFMMDSRYYRSPREVSNPVHWGPIQEEFLFENLSQSKSPAWLMNGSQFFGGYLKKDAFEYWQIKNLQSVCARLAKQEAPVVFASGDVHFSEYMKIEPQILGYQTFEITSSSIHSTTFPLNHRREKNPRRIDASSAHQFTNVITTVDPTTGWTLNAQSFKAGLKETFSANMVVKRG